jgi:hypothetical protein
MSSLSLFTAAQEPRKLQLPAPPPMKFVSLDERSQLTASKDPKSRVRTTIELAETHLKRAENLTSQKRFDQASEELGGYLGLIDDGLSFIDGLNRDKGSTRDLYRHLDLALRTHIPRLAVMRRATPVDYSINIKAAEEYVRDTRAQALDSFYGHTVLRDSETNTRKSDKTKDSPGENKRP